MTFQELGLEPMLLKAVTEMGFENPTPIQEQTIPQLQGKSTDMVALAQTGTGKTFTMEGFKYNMHDEERGIIPRAV